MKQTLKKTFLGIGLLIQSLMLNGQQTYFSQIYNPFNRSVIGRHVIVTDSGYVVGGAGRLSSSTLQKLIMLKLDSNGIGQSVVIPVLDSNSHTPGMPGAFFKTKDEGYAWIGQSESPIRVYSYIVKFDVEYNVLWKQDYFLNNDTVYSFMDMLNGKETSDSGFVLVGEVDTPTQYNQDICLIKTDSLGNEKWRKSYNFKGMDCGWNTIETPDRGFLIGAGGYVAGLKHSYSGLVIKTDSLGNEQWRKTIGSSNYDDYYCVVANSPDGNFIVGTTTGVGIINNDESWRRIRLLKISPSGAVLWDKMYVEKHGSSALNNLLILPNGDIVAIGSYYPANLQQTDSWSWLLKLNTHGDSLWMREHYYFNNSYNTNRLFDIKQTPDGGFIACGYVDSMPAVTQSIWVLKLDSFGCLVPGCQHVGIQELQQSEVELKVYPNPTHDYFIVEYKLDIEDKGVLQISDAGGRQLKRIELKTAKGTEVIGCKDWSPGFYNISLISSRNGIKSVKLYVQH